MESRENKEVTKQGAGMDLGILCRRCGNVMEVVVDTRKEPAGVRRRRQCVKCGWRGTSRETLI